jgi:hypothetical protein
MSTVTFFNNIDTINHFKIYGLIIDASLASPIFSGSIGNVFHIDNIVIGFFTIKLFVLKVTDTLHITNIFLYNVSLSSIFTV